MEGGEIHALIPARGGSKSIPRKNIRSYRGKPLIVHSIELAKRSEFIDRVILTTDDEEIARIGRQHGAEAPFLRPAEISGDHSTDLEFFQHYLQWLQDNDQNIPALIVHLRPTYPDRSLRILNMCISLFLQNIDNFDSLRTVIPFEKSPYKMYRVENGRLSPLFEQVDNVIEPYNAARQVLPQCYLHNGYIDILKPSTILEKNSVTGTHIIPYVMDGNEVHDIDTYQDWEKSEKRRPNKN